MYSGVRKGVRLCSKTISRDQFLIRFNKYQKSKILIENGFLRRTRSIIHKVLTKYLSWSTFDNEPGSSKWFVKVEANRWARFFLSFFKRQQKIVVWNSHCSKSRLIHLQLDSVVFTQWPVDFIPASVLYVDICE